MTSLVPQASTLALDGVADLATILTVLANKKVAAAPEKPATASKPVPWSTETQEAISRLPVELEAVKLPSTRRALTLDEQKAIALAGYDAKRVKNDLDKVVNALKTSVFNHLDVRLEDDNDPGSLPLDKAGKNYLVEGTLPVPGTDLKFVRQLAQGAPRVTEKGLHKLLDEGKIDRKTYLKLTRKVDAPREVDEEALLEWLSDEEAREVVAPVIEPGTVVASFWIKPVDETD